MAAIASSLLGAAQGALWDLVSYQPRWGVFPPGKTKPAFKVDSVVDMSTRREAQTADFRIETGSFASYNKVQRPQEVAIRMTVGGREGPRTKFLQWLEDNVSKTTLFDVAMPERTLKDATLTGYSVRREARSGVTLIIADCYFIEIRQVEAQYSGGKKADTSAAAKPADQPAKPTIRAQAEALVTKAQNAVAGAVDAVQGAISSASEAVASAAEAAFK